MPQNQATGSNANAFGHAMAAQVAKALDLRLLAPGKNNLCESPKGLAIIKSARTSLYLGILKTHLEKIRIVYGVLPEPAGGAAIFELTRELFDRHKVKPALEKNSHLLFIRVSDVRKVGTRVLLMPAAPTPTQKATAPAGDHSQLFEAYNKAMGDMLAAGLIRSTNNPLGDYAEYLIAKSLDLKLVGKSAKGYDATDLRGKRYQIKSRRPTASNPSRQLGGFRDLDEKLFDFCLAGIFSEDFSLKELWEIPHERIREFAKRTTRGFSTIILDGRILKAPGVRRLV